MTDWSETRLSKAIGDSLTRREQTALSSALDQAELVLKSTGTSPLDFTLHDQDHSFRVAERIFDLIPPNVSLGTYEFSLLLLSAYMHDIGMSPTRQSVASVYDYLITGQSAGMTAEKLKELRHWLDANHSGITVPTDLNSLTPAGLRYVDEIVSYYSRHKHNDWSEEWIRNSLPELSSALYANWVDDVVTLCRSHHEGLSALRSSRFDAKLVGSTGQTVNLRYLASLLRLADVLEFDPERTPPIILDRRDIAQRSRIFWQRDHEIAFYCDAAEGAILLTARTPNAYVHKAVLESALAVNHELAICATLEHEGLFKVGKIPNAHRDRYIWSWPSQLATDISEKDSSFVYIEGAFRPDTKRVLDLLSGVALYGNPLAAIRELLQNAVDAVKEQIAYERLSDENPGSSDFSEKWSQIHRIRMSLEEDTDGIWLRCVDDGIGMTKEIIENNLLVSGSTSRAATKTLERETAEKGFSIGRTGQFGVGTLSYFMLSDRLELITRSSSLAGDNDHTAWRFTTEGLGSFGELRPTSRSTNGTEVRLRIRREVFGENASIFSQISDYVSRCISFLPCRFEFRDNIGGEMPLELPAGWTHDVNAVGKNCIPGGYYYPLSVRRTSAQIDFEHGAVNSLRWLGPEEFSFEPLAARVRVWFPYFAMPDGNCSAYMHIDDSSPSPIQEPTKFFKPSQHVDLSWRGFKVEGRGTLKFTGNVLTQIDIGSGANISVDRGHLDFPGNALSLLISNASRRLAERFLQGNSSSKFNAVNVSTLTSDVSDLGLWWFTDSGEWSLIRPPFSELFGFSHESEPLGGNTTIANVSVQRLLRMKVDHNELSASEIFDGGRIVLTRDNSSYGLLQIAAVWEEQPSPYLYGARSFPKSLRGLLSVSCDGRTALNADHFIASAVSKCGFVNVDSIGAECSDEELASALHSIIRLDVKAWLSFVSKDGIKDRVIEYLSGCPVQFIDCWTADGSSQYIKTIDLRGRHIRKQEFYIKQLETYDGRIFHLPDDPEDWLEIRGAVFHKRSEEPIIRTTPF